MSGDLKSSGIPAEAIEKMQQVFERYPEIERVGLYGSRAKGNFHQGSDIDLTIMGDAVSEAQMLRIETELDDLLLPFKIDLSLLRTIANVDLVAHIQRVGIDFYCREQ